MKTTTNLATAFAFLALSSLQGPWSTASGVTFTVTPSAVSNTYTGTITLQISNFPAGDTVVIQKYLDVNGSGVIASNDWLAQQYTLTDNQTGMVIGGVTNLNVPGDLNAAAGAITATLNFNNGDFVQNVSGTYLFEVSSPAGHFGPVTNSLAVTNFPYAQKITGIVVSNGVGGVVPGALVMLFGPPEPGKGGPSGSPIGGVLADNVGTYTLLAPAGTYMPFALKNNYLSDFGALPVVTLTNTQTLTTNLVLANATATISGRLVDAGNTNLGLPGILISAQSSNGLMAICDSDTNGNFIMGVQSGQYGVKINDTSLIVHGYLSCQNRTNVNAGSTGVLVTAPRATGLFYGSVKDSLGNPLVGVDVYVNDDNSAYETDGYTDANGNYLAGALGGLTNDAWQVEFNSDSQTANYIFSQPDCDQDGGTNLVAGTAVPASFTAVLATNHISGYLTNAVTGAGIGGIGMPAWATINGIQYNQYISTDDNGFYSNNVANGSWTVSVNCGCGYGDCLLGYVCPDSQMANITNNNVVLNFSAEPCTSVVSIVTTSLPAGEVNVFYDQYVQASSCYGNFTWALISGSLPPGLSGYSWGEINGTPTNTGTWDFTVQVTDGEGATATQALSLTINAQAPGLQITTTSLPNGTSGLFYSEQLLGSGGEPPYTWSLSSGSEPLPANLTLSTNGVLAGIPAGNGTSWFIVEATDSAWNTVEELLSLTIGPVPQSIVLVSGASTLAAALGSEAPTSSMLSLLDSGNDTGLSFEAALVGAYGTDTPVPVGAPEGTEVINIPPGDGESGFFEVSFVLPAGYQDAQLSGSANVDDNGRAFLNGNPISPSLSSNGPGVITEIGNAQFTTANAGYFQAGTNQLLIADDNTGGPSGAAFYAIVTYQLSAGSSGFTLTNPARQANGQFQFSLDTVSGVTYVIQASTNLKTWTPLLTFDGPGGLITIIDPNAPGLSRRFYRVKAGP